MHTREITTAISATRVIRNLFFTLEMAQMPNYVYAYRQATTESLCLKNPKVKSVLLTLVATP